MIQLIHDNPAISIPVWLLIGFICWTWINYIAYMNNVKDPIGRIVFLFTSLFFGPFAILLALIISLGVFGKVYLGLRLK